jgi:hypothetical protein
MPPCTRDSGSLEGGALPQLYDANAPVIGSIAGIKRLGTPACGHAGRVAVFFLRHAMYVDGRWLLLFDVLVSHG